MGKRAKVIKLLLDDGTLKGIINMAEDEWIGDFYSAPRNNVKDILKDEICSRWGIYLLLSNNCVYVGQSKNLKQRIEQHLLGKDWWENVVILTTKDDSFNKSDIDYLENVLIEKANKLDTLDVDNIKKGNPAKVDKFRSATLDQYLEESLFLLEFIGVEVFSDNNKHTSIKKIVPNNSAENIELRAKGEVLKYLKNNKINLHDKKSYAKLQVNKNAFWINPKVEFLNEYWTIILNNQLTNEIIVLSVPPNTFECSYPKNNNMLVTRKDKRYYIDLLIDCVSFVDRNSGMPFAKYITNKIKY